jgi:hypothetical protein
MIDYPNARYELGQAEAALAAAALHLDRAHAALEGDRFLSPPAQALRGDVAYSLRRCKALSAHIRAHSPKIHSAAPAGALPTSLMRT